MLRGLKPCLRHRLKLMHFGLIHFPLLVMGELGILLFSESYVAVYENPKIEGGRGALFWPNY